MERQINKLDSSEVEQVYHGNGVAAYDPMVMLKMVVYQYLKGNQSPAAWHEEASLNKAMKWLGRGYEPSRRTWYDFRDRAGKFVDQVHQQILRRALDQKILEPSIGVQDGTAVAACASRHRMVNRPTLEKRTQQLAEIMENSFDDEFPKWVPPTDSGKRDLAERMQQAREVLCERIDKNAKKRSDKRKDPDKIQVSLSDPVAPLGRDKLKVFRPLYTVQYVVAPESYLIMAYCCEPSVTDAGTLAPMVDKTQVVVGGRLQTMLADAAYCSIVDLQDCQDRNVELLAPVQSNTFTSSKKKAKPQQLSREEFRWDEPEGCYYCPEGHRLNFESRTRKSRHSGRTLWESRYRCSPTHCGSCPLAKQCLRQGASARTIKRLQGQELLDEQREKMATEEVQSRYRIRGQTVELLYADSKGNRKLTRFHGRGPQRARTETGLMVIAQNLRRLDRLERKTLNPCKTTT